MAVDRSLAELAGDVRVGDGTLPTRPARCASFWNGSLLRLELWSWNMSRTLPTKFTRKCS